MKKKAEDLKPGDVLPANTAYSRRIVLAVLPSETMGDLVAIRIFGATSGILDTLIECAEREYEVESPALSPAQQHAVMLVELARLAADMDPQALGVESTVVRNMAIDLLAHIDSPKPPSLEEALAALAMICDSDSEQNDCRAMQNAQMLLDRYRAAGYPGKDAQ